MGSREYQPRLTPWGLILLATLGCRSSKERENTAETSAAVASTPPPAPSVTTPPFVGAWRGSYVARQHKIELDNKHLRIKDWEQDDGSELSGKGQLELRIDDRGQVSGNLNGALGSLKAVGEFHGDQLSARLTPASGQPEALAGILTGKLANEVIRGEIQASSGDSRIVRAGSFELKKSGPGP